MKLRYESSGELNIDGTSIGLESETADLNSNNIRMVLTTKQRFSLIRQLVGNLPFEELTPHDAMSIASDVSNMVACHIHRCSSRAEPI